jgi:hypothetical protein
LVPARRRPRSCASATGSGSKCTTRTAGRIRRHRPEVRPPPESVRPCGPSRGAARRSQCPFAPGLPFRRAPTALAPHSRAFVASLLRHEAALPTMRTHATFEQRR